MTVRRVKVRRTNHPREDLGVITYPWQVEVVTVRSSGAVSVRLVDRFSHWRHAMRAASGVAASWQWTGPR